ncbi:hypothetical protein OPV22_004131 [Ensete ventricosum]|uniref:Jacalin-type lectin domain-containing protein n=1 Tax=Ensete ventricosum TaxID=4639 RepID=A0AAV8S2X9_ENSVE|nr:hypothetical protein OPV22_004131 [Ensete ventricosum]RWW53669.1 hypothetical protein BHE74_00039848 [Ensete ventricosum]
MDISAGNRILKVQLRHGVAIDAIKIMYRRNGADVWTDQWGGGGGQFSEFNLDDGESLRSIRGHYGRFAGVTVVRSVTFISDKRTYGPYGGEGGIAFELEAPDKRIVGFTARSGLYLDALGIYVA